MLRKILHYGFRVYVALCLSACTFFTGMTFMLTEEYRFNSSAVNQELEELKEIRYELQKQNRDLPLGRRGVNAQLFTH